MDGANFLEAAATPIRRAAVVGAGTMGTGIAIAFANADIPVVLTDASDESLGRARAAIAAYFAGQTAKGRIDDAQRERRIAGIRLSEHLDDVADADAVVEAVFERADLKREVFAQLGARCGAGALLATNTSTLDVDAIAAAAPHLERSLGLHFFSPAHVMKLLEVVRGAKTSPQTLDRAVALAKRLGKIPVVVGNCDGFVGNRMLLGYRREADFLVLAGVRPEGVDRTLEEFGFAMGPFAVADLAGIDIGYNAKRERIARGAAPPFAVTDLPDAFVAAGRLGQKTGQGWYRYEPGDRTRRPDPAIEPFIEAERARLGVTERAVSHEEIVERCVYALINEGARILGDGIAASASDIDTVWINGYGFPKARGGPMKYAEDIGLLNVLAAIERYALADPAFWRPAPLLVAAAKEGRFPA
ncbi:MAG: 3-hydroxyacyl-CoA dehydrogenase [Candidatus Eremiobacteraeota bacterium]|nr:3-hydroxyacyl-CoA dehydrogenase [Candidatus Eremiobacteraeota bacterium]